MHKRFYFLLFALLAFFVPVTGQTLTINISGTVTDAGTALPIANQDVYVMFDSINFPYFGTAVTNSNGEYSFNVTGVTPANGSFWVFLYDCNGQYQSSAQTFYSTNATTFPGIDFQICTGGGGGGSCAANFQANPVQGSTVVNFQDFSQAGGPTLSIVSWAWDFGDGSTSTLQNPSHTYNQQGMYGVCLTITASSGCTATICDTVNVGYGGGGGSCLAGFVFMNQGCTFSFYDSSYTANGPMTYLWDFGDGSTGTGANATHTYTSGGAYTVCLTIADAQGCTDTYCQTVLANCGGGGGGGCQASYFWYPDTTGQYTIVIVNTSSSNPNTSYFWDFGDGSSSTQATPSHVYAGPGYYAVCLTVIDSTPNNTCVSYFCDTLGVLNFTNSVPFSINVLNGLVGVDMSKNAIEGIELYPNPATELANLRFTLSEGGAASVTVMDMHGRLALQKDLGDCMAGEHQAELNLDGLTPGLYFVQVAAGGERVTKKLIINP